MYFNLCSCFSKAGISTCSGFLFYIYFEIKFFHIDNYLQVSGNTGPAFNRYTIGYGAIYH